jgi:hypothetical protein
LLVIILTSAVSAQQAEEDEEDLDIIAAEDLMRELRSERQAPEPVSDETVEEWLASGSQALDRMLEQGCELNAALNIRIQALEARLTSPSRLEAEMVRGLKLELVDSRQQALRDCCEQESVICAE